MEYRKLGRTGLLVSSASRRGWRDVGTAQSVSTGTTNP